MTRIIGSATLLGMAATAAQAHPGHGLEGLAHVLSHSFGGLFLLAVAGLLIYAAMKKHQG